MQEEQKKLMHNQETLLKEQSELQGELHLHKDTHFRDVLEHPDDVKSSKSTKYGQNKVTVGREQGKGLPRWARRPCSSLACLLQAPEEMETMT